MCWISQEAKDRSIQAACAKRLNQLLAALSSPALGLFLLTYSLVADMAAEAFDCARDDVSGLDVLRVDPSLVCVGGFGRCEGEHCQYVTVGLFVLLFCAVAVAAIALFLWRARPYLYTDERTMKAFSPREIGVWRLECNLRSSFLAGCWSHQSEWRRRFTLGRSLRRRRGGGRALLRRRRRRR